MLLVEPKLTKPLLKVNLCQNWYSVESFNVLLHELQGLGLDITLEE